MDVSERLRPLDRWVIAIACLALFGFASISDRPLTMHEARLPETSREMNARGDWLLPTSAGRPWLERPPLPHWIVITAMKLTGRDQSVAVARFPSAIMGTLTVLIAAAMAARWFGRNVGLMTALVLATSFEFWSYACLAEDDIYFAFTSVLTVYAFARAEWFAPPAVRRFSPVGWRAMSVLMFFVLLGVTNLTKGPLLGIAMIGPAVGVFLLSGLVGPKDVETSAAKRLLTWVWLPGWVVLIALTLAWPLHAYHVYPDVLENWKYDYLGRAGGGYTALNEPWYLYARALPAAVAPWTPACLIGLMATAGIAWRKPSSAAARFVWCWAIVPVLVLSIPKGKHHHYMVPLIAPWAMLGAIGAIEIGRWLMSLKLPGLLKTPLGATIACGIPNSITILAMHRKIPSPMPVVVLLAIVWTIVVALFFYGMLRRRPVVLAVSLLIGVGTGYCWGEQYVAASTDRTVDDTAFIRRASIETPANVSLFINANVGALEFFRLQFYARPDVRLVHNLTFLRDERITEPTVYVITRARDQSKLMQLGVVEQIDQSPKSHEDDGKPTGRFTLFKLTFDPNLKRYPVPTLITNKQGLQREPGPFCGPEL